MIEVKAESRVITPRVKAISAWQFNIPDVTYRDIMVQGAQTYQIKGAGKAYTVHVDRHGPFISVAAELGQMTARMGDWIIEFGQGRRDVVAESTMRQHYTWE